MDNAVIKGLNDAADSMLNLDEWVTVKVPGGGYLGKVNGAIYSRVASGDVDQRIKAFKSKVMQVLRDGGGWLELNPSLDFLTPMRPSQNPQTGQVSYSRDPIVGPMDFTSFAMSAMVQPVSIVFLVELQGKDKELYKSFVQQALTMMTRMRAEASGLVMPGGDMPRG